MPSVEDVRRTVRALVGVIQQAALGSSPVAESQVAHVRKVVRLLSLSHDQIDALPSAEREQVLSIRSSAVQKMKMAHALQDGYASSPPLTSPSRSPLFPTRTPEGAARDGNTLGSDVGGAGWGVATSSLGALSAMSSGTLRRSRSMGFPAMSSSSEGSIGDDGHCGCSGIGRSNNSDGSSAFSAPPACRGAIMGPPPPRLNFQQQLQQQQVQPNQPPQMHHHHHHQQQLDGGTQLSRPGF